VPEKHVQVLSNIIIQCDESQYDSTGGSSLPNFEECLSRLEAIVSELEKGDVPLENALKLFEEGMQLSGSCRKELEEAEGKVEILLKQNGKLQPEPFERAEARR
jgi:exodeoxyribonuclease VII small subunit